MPLILVYLSAFNSLVEEIKTRQYPNEDVAVDDVRCFPGAADHCIALKTRYT
jgi:hypothetical protein